MSRQVCINILHAHTAKFLPISREAYEWMLKEWTLEPIKAGGTVIGCVMIKDNEIHMATKPGANKHWPRRWMIRQFIGDRIRQFGHVVTSVGRDNVMAQNIVERLGFYRTGEDDQFIQYRIDNATIK